MEHAAVGAPVRKRDEAFAPGVARAVDRRMVGARNHDKALAEDGQVGEFAFGRRFRDKGGVEPPLGHLRDQAVVGAGREFEAHIGVATVKFGEHRRQAAGRRAFQRAEPQQPARLRVGDGMTGLFGQIDQARRVTQQQFAVR